MLQKKSRTGSAVDAPDLAEEVDAHADGDLAIGELVGLDGRSVGVEAHCYLSQDVSCGDAGGGPSPGAKATMRR